MSLETVMHSIQSLFVHRTTRELDEKFAAVEATTQHIQRQLRRIDRIAAVFDEWAEHHEGHLP